MRTQVFKLFLLASVLVFSPHARADGQALKMCQDEQVQPLPPPPAERPQDVVGGVKAVFRGLKSIFKGTGAVLGEAGTYIGAQAWMRDISYEPWNDVRDRLQEKVVKASQFPPRQAGEPSLLNEDAYRKEMGALFSASSVDFVPGNKVELLVNGCASFAKREELIDHAQDSIHIFVWAIYDDETGRVFFDWLSAAKNRRIAEGADLDVKIIVDGNLAKQAGTRDVLKQIEKKVFSNQTRIQVVRLKDKHDPYFGMHRKLMIVDGRHIVMGGMNAGNIYSHLGPDLHDGLWRDTDVYVTGPVANQAEKAFTDEWNVQTQSGDKLTFNPVQFAESPGSALSMIVDHQPLHDDNTYLAIMKAFYGATHTIDIENAYFITDPVNERAITDALKRGIKVRILSNSGESIDEPVMTVPIMETLARLQSLGAQVYLKKVYPISATLESKGPISTTIHSKFFVADGVFTAIGSYNFHPRSYRYEREVVLASFDEKLAQKMEEVFEADITPDHASGPQPEALNRLKPSSFNKLVEKDFFDQL